MAKEIIIKIFNILIYFIMILFIQLYFSEQGIFIYEGF